MIIYIALPVLFNNFSGDNNIHIHNNKHRCRHTPRSTLIDVTLTPSDGAHVRRQHRAQGKEVCSFLYYLVLDGQHRLNLLDVDLSRALLHLLGNGIVLCLTHHNRCLHLGVGVRVDVWNQCLESTVLSSS